MSVVAQNRAYMNDLKKKVRLALDVVVQSVTEEILIWAIVVTVQDSGNAVYFWNVEIDGNAMFAGYLRGTGHGEIGDRGEKRRPRETVDHSQSIKNLPAQAKYAAIKPLIEFQQQIKKTLIMTSGKYPAIAITNSIPDLTRDDVAHYEQNAFLFIAEAEARVFGLARGYEKALDHRRVSHVISRG